MFPCIAIYAIIHLHFKDIGKKNNEKGEFMSWDIFVQYIPDSVKSIKEMPADYSPRVIGMRSEIIALIRKIIPEANFSNPEWGLISENNFSIEINMGDNEEVKNFAFHVRGDDLAVGLIADILHRLGMRAFDSNSKTGIFDPAQSLNSLRQWQDYRDKILSE
jgi:hypothetical protein